MGLTVHTPHVGKLLPTPIKQTQEVSKTARVSRESATYFYRSLGPEFITNCRPYENMMGSAGEAVIWIYTAISINRIATVVLGLIMKSISWKNGLHFGHYFHFAKIIHSTGRTPGQPPTVLDLGTTWLLENAH